MNYLSDFHTHTTFCDGRSTPREMLFRAIELGFVAYGFSGHGGCAVPGITAMDGKTEEKYVAEILSLKEEFSDRIRIYLGIEAEYGEKRYFPKRICPSSPFDYVIGAVHLIETPAGLLPCDHSEGDIPPLLDGYFGGDFESLAESYFARAAKIPEKIDATFIAHIDLISKYKNVYSYTFGKRYYDAALGCVDELIPYGIPFEINVGAITRGLRTTPYPDTRILRHIRERGGEIMINGDCHSAEKLGKHFDLAEGLAISCGFTRRLVITDNGLDAVSL